MVRETTKAALLAAGIELTTNNVAQKPAFVPQDLAEIKDGVLTLPEGMKNQASDNIRSFGVKVLDPKADIGSATEKKSAYTV